MIPGLRDDLVTMRTFTPKDFAIELNAHLGSAFSLEPVLWQSAFFRTHNRDDVLKNLYFVGAGTHPGAGIPGVVGSAKATAKLMIADLGACSRASGITARRRWRPSDVTDALVAASRAAIARGSKSFALASRLFDPVTRDRATLLYAWCRYADDVIDGQVDGFGRVDAVGTPAERLAALEAGTRAALGGDWSWPPPHRVMLANASTHGRARRGACRLARPWVLAFASMTASVEGGHRAGSSRSLPFAALARVAAETDMPARYPLDLIEGFRSDVEERPFVTFDDTLTYCYHVAGCVGVMMAIVMGVPPDDRATLDRACDLGLAFQLNNIARDVVEDAANGRCYLPEDWLAEAGLSRARHVLRRARQPRRARDASSRASSTRPRRYAASSRFGTPALPWRSAWAVLAAADIYGGIGRRVRAEGAAALDRRVTTSRAEKLAAVARALPPALSRARRWPAPGPSRAGLWTIAALIRPPPSPRASPAGRGPAAHR